MLANMKHKASVRAGFLIALLSGAGLAQTRAEILEADLRRHVETLASDAMQGRSTGTPQAMEAARYIAAELKRARVAPAGDDGTYFQKVPMVRTEYSAIPKLSLVRAPGGGSASDAVAGVDFENLANPSLDRLRDEFARVSEGTMAEGVYHVEIR